MKCSFIITTNKQNLDDYACRILLVPFIFCQYWWCWLFFRLFLHSLWFLWLRIFKRYAQKMSNKIDLKILKKPLPLLFFWVNTLLYSSEISSRNSLSYLFATFFSCARILPSIKQICIQLEEDIFLPLWLVIYCISNIKFLWEFKSCFSSHCYQ